MLQVNYLIEQVDTKCPICLINVTTPLIQCQNGTHFICFDCLRKCSKKSCHCSGRYYHNKFLERLIKHEMVSCHNEKCPTLSFKWAIDEHKRDCIFNEFECRHCPKQISIPTQVKHFQTECSLLWISDSFDEGSDILLEQISDSSRGQLISMNKVQSSFSILSKDIVTVFNKSESVWSIDIIILNENSDNIIELTYWMPKTNNSFDSNTRITINPSKILNEDTPTITIPIESIELQYELVGPRRNSGRNEIEGFLRNLMDRNVNED